MGKRNVPPQLQAHAFSKGSAKAKTAGAKGGRKSPGTGKTASATKPSATAPKRKTTSPKPAKIGSKRTTSKR